MSFDKTLIVAFVFAAGIAVAADPEQPAAEIDASVSPDAPVASEQVAANSSADGPKTMSGMSILGNEEAPKALVIVPWKSSELGDDLSLSESLDDRAKPVDKKVFLRELSYYEIRAGKK